MKNSKHDTIKKICQRTISFLTGLTLAFNSMYSVEFLDLFHFSTILAATAEEEVTPSYVPTNPVSAFSGSSLTFPDTIDGYKKFVDYCYYYSVNEGGSFCADHRIDTLTINFYSLTDGYSFMGLGNETVPFAGTLNFIATSGSINISFPRALFTHVSTDAKIKNNNGNDITLEITKNSSESSPLFADYVHPGTDAGNWSIKVASGNTNAFAGVIGQIETGATVSLTFENASSAAVSNTASGDNDIKDVGELCGIMKTGSSLTVTDTTSTRPAVSSANGNAGSLVGTMEGTASLTLSSCPVFSSVSVTSENGYAGGLVGEMSSTATISGLSEPLDVGGTVSGTTGAGGLYGHYINSATTFDMKKYNITASVYAQNCGGVFGVLENNKGLTETPLEFTIKNTGNAGTVNVSSGSQTTYATTGYFGGIAGKYTTDHLKNSLILDSFNITATSNASFASFGGAIGLVDSAAYIKSDGMNITATGTARRDSAAYFGGLIGKTSATNGVFADLGDFTLSADSGGFKGGGIVGSFKNGVLRLSGTTDMSSAKSQKGGQLVGVNDNVLTYALGTGKNGTAYVSGWTFKRSNGSNVDDLGTWGEVVRISSVEKKDPLEGEDTSASILVYNSTEHTVKVSSAVTSISSAAEFTRTALNIQLNQGSNYDCLLFTSGDANKRENLLKNKSLTIGTVSLAGTGITGFMRDGGDNVGAFTGTLTGSGTVTLAIGEKYGQTSTGTAITSSTNAEGLGQIYAHPYNGLFAVIGNGTTGTGTVKSLTIDGSINVRNTIDGMNVGGIAAVSKGNTTLTGITAIQTVNYGEPASVEGTEAAGKNIGGLIGLANGTDNGTIAITGTNTIGTTFNISNYFNSWNALGAFIGKVTSPNFTINIAQGASDKLTVSHTMTDSGFTAGTKADGGGLIGYITSGTYSDRKVNIKNLVFDGCTIINKASNNGGGFLGYAWLGTDTTIDGLEVKGASAITNTSPNVGVMCYAATGRWKVNSLDLKKMSLSGGAGISLGMLVNKMYTADGSGNVNGALYLDVLNSEYTLGGSDVSLPGTIGLYDEIAVYSAPDVVAGGAGVISINMNSARNTGPALITSTGTYQNKLSNTSSDGLASAKYHNGNARYYYNLDRMSTSDAGQNLVLWSVGKYAYSGITSAIPATTFADTNLNGTANLAGLSYYPVAKADNYTLNGLNVTFDYDSIFTTAEATFPTGLTTDGYVRDPGATGVNKNQHYLMHGGLFINLPAGKTITVSGSSSLGGNFLEVDGCQAALIGGTMNGNLNISGSLDLNGLIPKTTGNALYDDGYLLINNVARPDTQIPTVSINISGLTASGYSSATLPIAKSLIGAADGRGFMFDFSGIKLDGRKAAVSDSSTNSALTTAYGTSRSLFSDAILFYSINTDRNAEMTYNFTYDDDWGTGTGSTAKRNVTYGNEISHTIEYWDTEHSKSRQSKYSGTRKDFTNPTGANELYDFSKTVFLPYVCVPYDVDADHSVKYYRELKVNYLLEIESKGCGTYNDPYIIESPEQLIAIAAFIKSGNTSSINLNSIILPKYDATKHHGVELNSTGNRWCTDKDGDDYHVEYSAKTGGGFEATGCTDWPDADARYYLASAYYKIENNINLGSEFDGFGGTEANYAFRGVIVGETDEQGTPKYTITNKSQNPLIYVSNGSVIKDVNVVINYSNGIQLQQDNCSSTDAYFGYDYASADTCNFYGGIIGEIMGGDNIIDNSYVTFSNTSITLKGNSATIVPVGGYVGVVVYGGLIFKNMTAAKTTISQTGLSVTKIEENYNLADNSDQEAWSAIYVNPIVGRVINGYAVNETGGNAKKADGTSVKQFSTSEDGYYHDDDKTERTGAVLHTLKNGKKHYTIADIDPDVNDYAQLDVTSIPTSATANGNINVPNAQALFVLSLITQSGAGTAQTLNDPESNGTHTDELDTISDETDASGNRVIHKTRTITDIDDSMSSYVNSLSYGNNGSVIYGMSHTADYDEVGSSETSSSHCDDFATYVDYDTAANTALPYIISHYTVGGLKTESTEVEGEPVVVPHTTPGSIDPFEGSDPDGMWLYITETNNNIVYYMDASDSYSYGFRANPPSNTGEITATKMLFTKQKSGDNKDKYTISFNYNGIMTYIGFNGNTRNIIRTSDPYYFNITKDSGKWRIYTSASIASNNNTLRGRNLGGNSEFCGQSNSTTLVFYIETPGTTTTETTYTKTITRTNIIAYPARCVTSTLGYYNINLATGVSYQLPDSFRGLGCVGIYDPIVDVAAAGNTPATYFRNNKYSMKVDQFDGKGCTIDQDIYLNKFENDNYFNVLHAGATQYLGGDAEEYVGNSSGGVINNHGIGLFDNVVTKNSSSQISDFILSGSVNTEIYSNTYAKSGQELTLITTTDHANKSIWLSVGGVCGWSTKDNDLYFNKIRLNNLSVNGADFVGGLLGFSGTSSPTVLVTIRECSATNISINMSSANMVNQTNSANDSVQARNGMGCFVGKVLEGAVHIYGVANTTATTLNTDFTKFSTVTIKEFGFADDTLEYYTTAGGLVGFAGNGCKVYDMKVMPADGQTITIGSDLTRYAGGLVGLMQPYKTNESTCEAVFYNCTVEKINVKAHYAGGFYGGKWINTYSPYKIMINNCNVIGDTNTNNTITGTNMTNAGYAGGFLGCGNVYTDGNPNIEIADSKVSNYTITSNASTAYVGGFIGYTGAQANGKSITCYIHDSSVEDCSIGTGNNYSGGAIGRVVAQNANSTNRILGYNIKLDNVISQSSKMGAWVGYLEDSKTSIQFNGMAIYGRGYANNIGSIKKGITNNNASFVFADYDGMCRTVEDDEAPDVSNYNRTTGASGNSVEMPKYPYVNINPQSSMGTGEIISGDGAVLYGSDVSGFTGTGAKTMAAKIYSERNTSGTAQQYYKTYVDTAINGGDTINFYMNKTTTDDGDRISNYYAEKGYDTPQDYDNFACIVIANNTTDETTALINRYAQLVTNTTTDYAGTDASNTYFDIVVNSCKLQGGKFEIDTSANAEAGLTYSGGQFSLNGAHADSKSADDSFTLVDIQFKDPLDTTKIAYHLYIPVYTIKEIEVNFSAAVMNGTNSASYSAGVESNPYGPKLAITGADTHIDNLNTWFTTYIRYTYSHEDLQGLLDSGNLNWNHKKIFYIDKYGNNQVSMLPDNTYMILVDPNGDHDKKYQVSLNSTDFAVINDRITFDFEKFEDSGDNSFSVSTFNELVAQKITATPNGSNNGKYNLYLGAAPENTGVTRYVYTKAADGTPTYYQYVGSGGDYDLTLDSGDVYENYYISMYVPGNENDSHLYGYYIRTPETFEAPSYESVTNNAVTKSAKVKCYYAETDKNGTNTINRQVYIGNVFNQSTELSVLPQDLEIDGGNHKLNIYATTTITPKDNDVFAILKGVTPEIDHSFNVFLDRKGENGEMTNEILGLEHDLSDPDNVVTGIQAWYSIGTQIPKDESADMSGFTRIDNSNIDLEKNYINVITGNLGPNIIANNGITIHARIQLDFEDYESEFPQKVANDTGVSVRAASNLAYEASSLAFSNMSESMEEPLASKHIYYRQSLSTASLNYYAKTELDCYDTDGSPSENYSRLGVSGKYSMNGYMPIDTTAQYNVQNIENSILDAENLVLTLSLQKKTDNLTGGVNPYAKYENVLDLTSYWGAVLRDPTTHEVIQNTITGAPETDANKTNLHIKCGTYDEIVEVNASNQSNDNPETITLKIPKAADQSPGFTVDGNGYIYIYVGFSAKTEDVKTNATDFTEYANYKVNLTAKLSNSTTGDIAGSYADDYLIYTNAKVNHDFLNLN